VASFFIPVRLRAHVAAVYAFARIADDIADEPGLGQQERLTYLAEWEDQLRTTLDGRPAHHPVFVALSEAMSIHRIPDTLFSDLLSAFRQDVVTDRYESFDDVRKYCDRSANPIGRIMLRLFGYDDEQLDAYSDAICTALQLTNFWQDFSQDLLRGRIYVPSEDLRRWNIADDTGGIAADEKKFREVMACQVDRTRALFMEGKPLLNRVKSGFSIHLRLTWHGGVRVLDKIERTGYNVLHTRPRLVGIDLAVIGYRALTRA